MQTILLVSYMDMGIYAELFTGWSCLLLFKILGLGLARSWITICTSSFHHQMARASNSFSKYLGASHQLLLQSAMMNTFRSCLNKFNQISKLLLNKSSQEGHYMIEETKCSARHDSRDDCCHKQTA